MARPERKSVQVQASVRTHAKLPPEDCWQLKERTYISNLEEHFNLFGTFNIFRGLRPGEIFKWEIETNAAPKDLQGLIQGAGLMGLGVGQNLQFPNTPLSIRARVYDVHSSFL